MRNLESGRLPVSNKDVEYGIVKARNCYAGPLWLTWSKIGGMIYDDQQTYNMAIWEFGCANRNFETNKW